MLMNLFFWYYIDASLHMIFLSILNFDEIFALGLEVEGWFGEAMS